jgi:hypothetical protein
MRNCWANLRNVAIVTSMLLAPAGLRAQAGAAANSGSAAQRGKAASQAPDLSGKWMIAPGGASLDPADPPGAHPDQLPMTPWARQRFDAAKPPFGAKGTFAQNDPEQLYCDPPGMTRLYQYPWQFTIVQTPGDVYMLFEFTHAWRLVTMNQPHAKDLDPTWLGDSVGKYEGDTLVIDTIGFNDKSWLDNVGHPHSDQLHTVERFRRASAEVLNLQLTIEDPKAYTKAFTTERNFKQGNFPLGETMCSISEDDSFQKTIMDKTVGTAAK